MLLIAEDPLFVEHDPGRGHPERPARLEAVHAGIAQAGRDLGGDGSLTLLAPRDATPEEITRVHTRAHVSRLEEIAEHGGGRLRPDTAMSARPWAAAVRAAGAGLAAAHPLPDRNRHAASPALPPT